MDAPPTVFIGRRYDDPEPWETEQKQPWPRLIRIPGEREWYGSTGGTTEQDEEAEFDSVIEAIRWGRERAEIVIVRLGTREDAMYSAGSSRANQMIDGSGGDYPEWPPDHWPRYAGPDTETRKLSEADLDRY
jgi:hypothetical protein